MNITHRLLMTFLTDSDKRVSFTLDDPREDITEKEIKDVMDLIIAKDIFSPSFAKIVSTVEAKIVTTDTVEYDLEVPEA